MANDLSISANVEPGTYKAAACIWGYQQGFLVLPNSYSVITVKSQTPAEVYGFDTQLFAYAQAANTGQYRKIYVKASMKAEVSYALDVSWQLTIYIYDSTGALRDQIRRNGSQTMDFSGDVSGTYISFNFDAYDDLKYNEYNVWNDYSGVGSQATYKVELIVDPVEDVSYRMTEEITPPILPANVNPPS